LIWDVFEHDVSRLAHSVVAQACTRFICHPISQLPFCSARAPLKLPHSPCVRIWCGRFIGMRYIASAGSHGAIHSFMTLCLLAECMKGPSPVHSVRHGSRACHLELCARSSPVHSVRHGSRALRSSCTKNAPFLCTDQSTPSNFGANVIHYYVMPHH
jgi:hypothetical protein